MPEQPSWPPRCSAIETGTDSGSRLYIDVSVYDELCVRKIYDRYMLYYMSFTTIITYSLPFMSFSLVFDILAVV